MIRMRPILPYLLKVTILVISLYLPLSTVAQEIQSIRPLSPYMAEDIMFRDMDGAPHHLHDFKGKPVILSFWASWCAPCLVEMPMLNRLQKQMGDKITILPIAIENQGPGAVHLFFEKARIRYLPVYVDTMHRALSIYKVRALPTSFLIDPEGNIVGKVEGAIAWDSPEIQSYLEKILMHP